MARTVFVDGAYVDEMDAKVSVFDRGFLFSDAVYEVTAVIEKKLVSWEGHTRRMRRSLGEIGIDLDMSNDHLLEVHRKLLELNEVQEGLVYLQITRGAADRDFAFPDRTTVKPTIVLFTQEKNLIDNQKLYTGLRVISFPDLRWGRSDIKSTQLLYASMVKQKALNQGKDEAWFVKDGFVSEGSSNNTFILSKDGKLITKALSNDILAGITRETILEYAKSSGYVIEERPFSVEEAKKSKEAFICSSTTFILPVVEIDDCKIGSGQPGKNTLKLREIYIKNIKQELV